jgi:hypothetical protein
LNKIIHAKRGVVRDLLKSCKEFVKVCPPILEVPPFSTSGILSPFLGCFLPEDGK